MPSEYLEPPLGRNQKKEEKKEITSRYAQKRKIGFWCRKEEEEEEEGHTHTHTHKDRERKRERLVNILKHGTKETRSMGPGNQNLKF